jgi:3-oxoacyl-[acyl-carrier protein] reductase
MPQLDQKVALVTGASRGIGKAIALELAQQGAYVAFTYASNKDKADEVVKAVQQAGGRAEAIQSNAAELEAAQAVVDQLVKEHGRLDIVVNNAGITADNLLLRMKEEQWDSVLNTNLKSVFNFTKAAARTMMKQQAGVFINMGSIVGQQGNAGQANYAASKAGIVGFTKSIAQELGSRNIRANVVAPGFIATEMTEQLGKQELEQWTQQIPMGRPGQPEEVAKLCAFLASDDASYISGQVLHINGAMA